MRKLAQNWEKVSGEIVTIAASQDTRHHVARKGQKEKGRREMEEKGMEAKEARKGGKEKEKEE